MGGVWRDIFKMVATGDACPVEIRVRFLTGDVRLAGLRVEIHLSFRNHRILCQNPGIPAIFNGDFSETSNL